MTVLPSSGVANSSARRVSVFPSILWCCEASGFFLDIRGADLNSPKMRNVICD